MRHPAHTLAALAAALFMLAPLSAGAQDEVANFYKGKAVTIQVGSDAGGQYDVIARTVARHMGKHVPGQPTMVVQNVPGSGGLKLLDRKSTRLNSSHLGISYAVFCLKKK